MTRFVDAIITYRILKKLVTPFEETQAYQLGIVDKNGKVLKKESQLTTPQERDAYTMLDRLVFRLKRIINKVPYENKRLLNLAAALTLVREHVHDEKEYVFLESDFISITPNEQTIHEVHDFFNENKVKSFALFLEDGIANAVGGGFSGQVNPNPNPNLAGRDIVAAKMARRKLPQMVGMKNVKSKA